MIGAKLILDHDGELVVIQPTGRQELLRDFIKRHRLRMGYTITRLEAAAGINHPAVYNFERGKAKSAGWLPDALDALGLELRIVQQQNIKLNTGD